MTTCYTTERKYTTCSVEIYVTIYSKIPWGKLSHFEWEMAISGKTFPVKTLLQDLTRKGPFFLYPCKILQDPTGSCKIMQGCKKKDLFLQDLARAFLLGLL